MAANFFYLIVFMAVMVTFWVSTQQLAVAVLALDYGVLVFWGSVPVVGKMFIGLLNVFAIATTLFYKPFTNEYRS